MKQTPPKFPRTYHLPFSPGLQNDDRLHTNPERFIGRDVVCTEKLDGGNTCIYNGEVYARSTGQPSKHPSFDYVKNHHVPRTFGVAEDLFLYGENLYAIHSIEYEALQDYFFLFAVTDGETWFSWEDVKLVAEACDFYTVPVIFTGEPQSMKHIEESALWCAYSEANSTKPIWYKRRSFLGSTMEGFVIRDSEAFPFDEYSERAAKYVRPNHIQSDEHWSKNWQPAKLVK